MSAYQKEITNTNNKINDLNEKLFNDTEVYFKDFRQHLSGDKFVTVSKDIMRKYESIFKRLKLQRVRNVPVRLNGKTGRGIFKECHSNVAELVEKVGGKVVRGYMLSRIGNMTAFVWHSVWETPEGKLVDVTMSASKDYFSQKEIQFAPVVTFDPSLHDYFYVNDFIVHDDRHKGLLMRSKKDSNEFNPPSESVPFNYFKKYHFKLVGENDSYTESNRHKEYKSDFGSNVFNIQKVSVRNEC